MKKLLLGLALAAMLVCVGTASADNPILTFSPNPAHVGDSIVFSGCGYQPGQYVVVQAIHDTKDATYIVQDGVTTDANGCLSTANAPYTLAAAGKWTASVWNGKHVVTINFTVT